MDKRLTFDATGTVCPIPILKTAQKILEIEVGEIIEILADDEGALEDFPAWCEQSGNEYLGVEEGADILKFYIRRRV
ncbi:sulfurtransferase TusA family protein [candidate division WOR-3 bacterium]|uniref:Sulfurtransferase TusA family protein n=1 Tax=candidate division WOR-3 bacterium TaxID=2052148 RepID=A0A9D5QE01_UNCW3|nr:sulfurtransferase TusA family protein [candidate division WOR-3 bacterium]MBD3365591.1 sulfurtransferase TusA family protein [candidate division WOR-3 bacterium]